DRQRHRDEHDDPGDDRGEDHVFADDGEDGDAEGGEGDEDPDVVAEPVLLLCHAPSLCRHGNRSSVNTSDTATVVARASEDNRKSWSACHWPAVWNPKPCASVWSVIASSSSVWSMNSWWSRSPSSPTYCMTMSTAASGSSRANSIPRITTRMKARNFSGFSSMASSVA